MPWNAHNRGHIFHSYTCVQVRIASAVLYEVASHPHVMLDRTSSSENRLDDVVYPHLCGTTLISEFIENVL